MLQLCVKEILCLWNTMLKCSAGLVHPAHVPAVLLAGHGQQLCQPHRLLLDEQEVS